MSVQARLIVVEGEVPDREIDLRLPVVIGRGPASGVRFTHRLISRKHCELSEKDGLLYVRDLGSLNGTHVDNQKITEKTVIHPNDLLRVGPITLRVVYQGPISAATGAAPPVSAQAARNGGPPPVEPVVVDPRRTAPLRDTTPLCDTTPEPAVLAAATANAPASSVNVGTGTDEQEFDDSQLVDFLKQLKVD